MLSLIKTCHMVDAKLASGVEMKHPLANRCSAKENGSRKRVEEKVGNVKRK